MPRIATIQPLRRDYADAVIAQYLAYGPDIVGDGWIAAWRYTDITYLGMPSSLMFYMAGCDTYVEYVAPGTWTRDEAIAVGTRWLGKCQAAQRYLDPMPLLAKYRKEV